MSKHLGSPLPESRAWEGANNEAVWTASAQACGLDLSDLAVKVFLENLGKKINKKSWIFRPALLHDLEATRTFFSFIMQSESRWLPSSASSNATAAALPTSKCNVTPEEKPTMSSGFPFHRSFTQATPFPDKVITKLSYSTREWQTQHCQDYRETAPGLMSLEMGWAQSVGGKCLSLITVISE